MCKELKHRIDELEDVLDCADVCCRYCGTPVDWNTLIGTRGYCHLCLSQNPHIAERVRLYGSISNHLDDIKEHLEGASKSK